MAADALSSTQVRVTYGWNATKNQTGYNGLTSNENLTKLLSFTLGTGASQINTVISMIRTLTAGSSEEVDLAVALADVVNNSAVALARIKALIIQLLSATDDSTNGTACSSITVGAAATNPWQGPFGATTDKLTIPNGGILLLGRADASGWTVTNGSADHLKVNNDDGANGAAYRLTLFGCDA